MPHHRSVGVAAAEAYEVSRAEAKLTSLALSVCAISMGLGLELNGQLADPAAPTTDA